MLCHHGTRSEANTEEIENQRCSSRFIKLKQSDRDYIMIYYDIL